MLEDTDYKIQDIPDEKYSAIEILIPEYKGVVIRVNYVRPAEVPNDDGTYTLSFDYDILDAKEFDKDKLIHDTNFSVAIGDIIVDLLTKNLETMKATDPMTEIEQIDADFAKILKDTPIESD